jgi:hemolysin III
VGFSIYGFSLLALFVFSSLHHGINGGPRVSAVLRTLDYVSIFILIGGTVTPIVLVLGRNPIGWSVLGAVWAIAILGIVLRSVYSSLPKHISNTFFIVLGWLPVALIGAGLDLSAGALALLAGGGVLYSAGFVLYVVEKPNINPGFFGFHELWHILVILAAASHYFLMYFYVLPK